MDIIRLENICKHYRTESYETKSLDDINITFKPNEMTAVVGRSGCGKSTLINIIAGLTSPTSGKYFFEGDLIDTGNRSALSKFRRKNIGLVVQNFALIGDMTIYQNIELPFNNKIMGKLRKKYIETMANELGIYEKLYLYPNQLSGGECQRAAIARCLIQNPKVILADEPTGALDHDNANNIISIFRNLSSTTTIILVTHDMSIAQQCDRIVTLSYGKIINNNE